MALKATVFKAELQVSDLNRHHYAGYALTLARHPSETDERMMLRLLAFALYADDGLAFTRGLSTGDEPDLWQHADDGRVRLWLELGQPEVRRLRQACGRAERVVVVTAGGRASELWWDRVAGETARLRDLEVLCIPEAAVRALGERVERSMRWTCTVDGATAWLDDGRGAVEVDLQVWQ